MAAKSDVIICGSGSAGLCAAVWLARLGIDFRVLEKRDGPLKIGQADGVQCRTVEVFESFNLRDELVKDAYWVNEVCFWSVQDTTGTANGDVEHIARINRTADVQPGLSWQPHVILNQARLNGLLIEDIKSHSGQGIEYGVAVKAVEVDSAAADDSAAYPVTVTAEKDGETLKYQAKYVLGCDGAHSAVRRSLGYKMVGDTTDAVWGVMDIFPLTNFPDIRKKATLRTKDGNLLIIPREGGSMVRFYIELPAGTNPKDVKLEDLQNSARKIFSQYTMDFAETFWWSAYSIGQRLADHFSKDNRVFLTGDACHTHSPKAGQGMNMSLQDGHNIGWKLAMVLKDQANPEILKTYNVEREKTAADLIAFDRELTAIFSRKGAKDNDTLAAARTFSEYFIKSGKYTAGLTISYADSMITNAKGSTPDLAKNVTVGMRFPSAQVVRYCDARAVQLAKALQSTGQWRILIFAGDILAPASADRLENLAGYLLSSSSPIRRCTPDGADLDSFVEPILILHGDRTKIEERPQIPEVFTPVNGKWKMADLYKVYVDDQSYNYGHGHAYDTLGIDVQAGAVIIVRPDQYVSSITALENHQAISDFFSFATQGK